MKNITLIAASIAAMALMSGSAFAQTAFDGAYAGASGGYGLGIIEMEGNGSTVTTGGKGLDGQVYAGFGSSSDAFYFGVEGNAGYSGLEHNASGFGATIDAKARESFGVVGRLGFSPAENNLLYGAAGIAYTKWEFTNGNTTQDEDVFSYRLGVGTQQVITENVFARLSVDFDIAKDPIDMGGGAEFRPITQTGRVGVGFRF